MSEKPDGDQEGGRSLAATIGGAVAIVAIVALGIWLVNELADSVKYSKCAAARHRNCDTIDYRSSPPPQ
jgi:uncharacterized membrane protein